MVKIFWGGERWKRLATGVVAGDSAEMRISSGLVVMLFILQVGCAAPYAKKDQEDKKLLKGQAEDPTFLAFLGRLRWAVGQRDRAVLSEMMTADFGYRWDTGVAGETPFGYWDQHQLWGELGMTLKGKFVAHEHFMVTPPAVVSDPSYQGWRVGMRNVNGAWKFGYFVPGEGVQ